ncbi:MAG: endonuclease MutS2 [Anaerolineaceae bacterium]|nr:endonuclease MutS2 [Anaerolineaceae bacterium]
MDIKSLQTLEFPKIIDQLTRFTAFSASADLARGLRPTDDPTRAIKRQARTSEAVRLLSEYAEVSIGGARDVRPQVRLASRGGVLDPEELLDVKATLISGRDLFRFFRKLPVDLPQLKAIGDYLAPPEGLIEAISRILDDKGEIKDSASQKLTVIRSDLKQANKRAVDALTRLINTPTTARMLQELIITKRHDRYVVPLRSEFKGRLKCVVQDQSASGATLFVEPIPVVDFNNARIVLAQAEKEEIQRILAEVSGNVGSSAREIEKVVHNLAVLDFSIACAKYALSLHAVEPILIPFQKNKEEIPDPILHLVKARHPLLDQETAVPIDIFLEKGTHALVITGPNTGGKTVSLKTTGLLSLMAQSGLHIPAQSGSQLCVFKDVFADIGDEQSIEQSLSTFSGHVANIVRILKHTGSRTLVLLDELGAGTDPQEGSALARGILSFLMRRQTPALIATHYPELKIFAHNAEGVLNASVEFDAKSLRPTYRLLIGIPGRSNALAIARRLGVPEEILSDAKEMIHPDDLQADDLLDDIQNQLENARRENARAEVLRAEVEAEKEQLLVQLEGIESERLRILEETRCAAKDEVDKLYMEINAIRERSKAPGKPAPLKKTLRRQVNALKEKLNEPVEKQYLRQQARRPLRIGDWVYVRRLEKDGIVSAVGMDEVEVQIGKMRVKVDLRGIERSKKQGNEVYENAPETDAINSGSEIFSPSPGSELRLIGMRAEDALLALEHYLDAAHAAGLPYVRIVHGKGTGTLRRVVREALGSAQLVAHWELAIDNEGGEGATIAFLKDN